MPIGPDPLPHGATSVRVSPANDADEGIGTLVHRAVEDARELAQAEIALVKAKAGERVTAYKNAAIFFGAAAVLALSAVTALLVGLILSLATLVGPGGATAIVVIATLAIAGLLALIGSKKMAAPKEAK